MIDMGIIFFLTYMLNLADTVFTDYWVKKYGIDVEGNPIGRYLITMDIMWIVKIFVVGVLIFILYIGYKETDNLCIKIGITICFIAYIIVTISHIICYIVLEM